MGTGVIVYFKSRSYSLDSATFAERPITKRPDGQAADGLSQFDGARASNP